MIINNKINISERTEKANHRVEFGHFEANTIFSCSGSKSALLVLVDRLTRKTHIKKLERKTAFLTSSSIVFALSEYNILHPLINDGPNSQHVTGQAVDFTIRRYDSKTNY